MIELGHSETNTSDKLCTLKSTNSKETFALKITQTDYDNYLIKVTENGFYLLMTDLNDSTTADRLISTFSISGVRVN